MFRNFSDKVILLVVLAFGAQAYADDFVMRHVSEFDDDTAVPLIIGGTKANPYQWPATFIINKRCTSTVVGPKVVLTAAHCVKDGSRGTISINGRNIRMWT